MEDAFPAESEYPAVADAAEEEVEEEEDEKKHAEAPPVVVAAAAKKRGRPAGSKNRAPDVYTALLDRMTQLEETLTRRPPPPNPRREEHPKTHPQSDKAQEAGQAKAGGSGSAGAASYEPGRSAHGSNQQAREARRQQQLNFYATFLP